MDKGTGAGNVGFVAFRHPAGLLDRAKVAEAGRWAAFGGAEAGMSGIRALVAGNWKMNGRNASTSELDALIRGLAGGAPPRADIMVCPPATLLAAFAARAKKSPVAIGAQDCHTAPSGAHTGDISAEMLADAGAAAVIVGHSERRAEHGESDALVRDKAFAAHRAGLAAIICVGETAAQRKAGETLGVVAGQLSGSIPEDARANDTIIAYEPVWAIGTGLTPTRDDVAAVHAMIRQELERLAGAEGCAMRVLYGGSVKPDNASELMSVADVNGALVGGASLKASDFLGIVAAYR
jgi:triosephosphate isomerase